MHGRHSVRAMFNHFQTWKYQHEFPNNFLFAFENCIWNTSHSHFNRPMNNSMVRTISVAWQYPEKFFVDTNNCTHIKTSLTMTEEYESLSPVNPNQFRQPNLQIRQTIAEPPLHFLNISSSAHMTTTTSKDESLVTTYQTCYNLSTNFDANSSISTNDLVTKPSNAINVNKTPHHNAVNSITNSTQQRRGSLQLWQFLVALLDDPTSR